MRQKQKITRYGVLKMVTLLGAFTFGTGMAVAALAMLTVGTLMVFGAIPFGPPPMLTGYGVVIALWGAVIRLAAGILNSWLESR